MLAGAVGTSCSNTDIAKENERIIRKAVGRGRHVSENWLVWHHFAKNIGIFEMDTNNREMEGI